MPYFCEDKSCACLKRDEFMMHCKGCDELYSYSQERNDCEVCNDCFELIKSIRKKQ